MKPGVITTNQHNPGLEEHLTGDLHTTQTGDLLGQASPLMDDGTSFPDFGDLSDLGPGSFDAGDIVNLRNMGSFLESGAIMAPTDFDKAARSAAGLRPLVNQRIATIKPGGPLPAGTNSMLGLRALDSVRSQGLAVASHALRNAGVSKPSSQVGLITTAETTARMNLLGQRALGKYAPDDLLPFITVGSGNIIDITGIRTGAGMKASALQWQLRNQENTLPYKSFISSSIPTSGVPVNLTSVLANSNEDTPVVLLMVVLSAPALTANSSKVFKIGLIADTGATPTAAPMYTVNAQYADNSLTLLLAGIRESSGNYYLRPLTMNKATVPADQRNVAIVVEGCDGTNDNLTIVALGCDNEYIMTLNKRFM